MKKVISGIQQIGIGNPSVYEAWEFYRNAFKVDVPIFDEAAEAKLMLPYTDGKPQERHAVLALNMQGGGGFEIWQYTKRKPAYPNFQVQIGDLGIYTAKIKAKNVNLAYKKLKDKNINIIGGLQKDPLNNDFFVVKDIYNNYFQVVKSTDWFSINKDFTGGVFGAMIGVSDIDKAKKLYCDILGYDKILYDKTGNFKDLEIFEGGDKKFRRILLTHTEKRKGAFSELLGDSEIELIQVLDREPKKIFKDRLWGDMGFIHLCFDVRGMEIIEKECKEKGFPFTVDSSANFDMGDAAGHFTYIEDHDGTLIEFVETKKLPILKKIGWFLDLRKRDPEKKLPRWMLKALALNRKK